MAQPFKPTRADGRSYRDVLVDAIKDREPETVVPFAELGQILDLDPTAELRKIQATVRRAIKPMLELYRRGLTSVSGVGYRVLPAREHMIVASSHRGKADRAMTRALAFYEGTDLAEMTETERKLHHGQWILAQAIAASHRHLDKRISRIEELIGNKATIEQN